MTAQSPVARLEPMRWWHVEGAAAVEAGLFGETAWSAEVFWSELARSATRCYTVALADVGGVDQVVGYAGLMVSGAEADVQTVAVAPSWQGRRLGERLLTRLLGQAGERGVRTVLLEVHRDNLPAVNLYRRSGFEQIAVRRGYYGPGADALIMKRVLS